MATGRLTKAIKYILSNPSKLIRPEEKGKDIEVSNPLSKSTNISRYGIQTPNVLTPDRVLERFNSGLYVRDSKEIQKIAPYLVQASDDNLSELNAKELFELVQMPHPKDYGFSVTRSAMLREWEKRGQQMFEELGFPIDPEYPYVNLNRGYQSVYPLKQILRENEKQIWWYAASAHRPIADLEKALTIIEEEIDDFRNQQLVHTNPKTRKPKSKKENKKLYQDIEFKIEDLQNSEELIKAYLESQKQKTTPKDSEQPKQVETSTVEDFFYINKTKVDQIRKKFYSEGFKIYFTGKQAFVQNVSICLLYTSPSPRD